MKSKLQVRDHYWIDLTDQGSENFAVPVGHSEAWPASVLFPFVLEAAEEEEVVASNRTSVFVMVEKSEAAVGEEVAEVEGVQVTISKYVLTASKS